MTNTLPVSTAPDPAERRRPPALPDHLGGAAAALDHLRAADPVISQIIAAVGPYTLAPDPRPFRTLVSSIISQQVSGKAADTILRRLLELCCPAASDEVMPEHLLAGSVEQMREVGVSWAKASYLLDLATKVQSKDVDLDQLPALSDEDVIAQLIRIKGIGRWTAEMYLIFCLGRPDVWPVDDLGVRAALRDFFGLDRLPSRAEALALGQPWRPYRSIATWYLWAGIESKVPILAGQIRQDQSLVEAVNPLPDKPKRPKRDKTISNAGLSTPHEQETGE